jgi:hypothetical protein
MLWKAIYFQGSIGFTSGQKEGSAELIAAGIKCLLSKSWAELNPSYIR